jgi:hypothetical protein
LRQPISALHRDALLMAALRTTILLEADPTAVSLSHGLKEPPVQAALLRELEARRGADFFSPTRAKLIEEFLQTYREIDWKAHGRLTRLRNLGVAPLAADQPPPCTGGPRSPTSGTSLASCACSWNLTKQGT